MEIVPNTALAAYWSPTEVSVNVIVCLNLLGALALGLVVGYERSYRGRAAGMRTYGLVCMASAALTVLCGYPDFWFGGHAAIKAAADPTRVIQGIVTGIGFLGAGVIMKEGFSISGLTTAASIWSASAIGVMVGLGFYVSAIALSFLAMVCMMWVSKLEAWLPSRPAIAITLHFVPDVIPTEAALQKIALEHGYEIASGSLSISAHIASGSLSISAHDGKQQWHFVAVAINKRDHSRLSALAYHLSRHEGVERFQLSHARN
ncbi:MgtC/SapB family protein [Chitinivorax sp. B]|uniref:MgtC/SapB family protein n=1 Tax=Chitinivorax sp. B TaxID=2502235 RepID=UPI0010F8886C|nr:MgtC/SapB family protein [Chitinivorax sp. B]